MADNTNQIIFPAEFGALRGRIAPIVQDSPSTYTIYARRKNGAYVDITGQTPTAKFTSTTAGGSVYTSTGTFTVTDGEAGEFTWLPSAADLGLDGAYYLQFTIDGERSEDRLRWVIQERLDSSGSVTPMAMAALSADELALVTALESALPAAEGDIFKYTGGAWTTTAESGGGSAWGDITGTLANQTDLQTALNDLNANINTTFNDLETHIETTTNVHGIADTSDILTSIDIDLTVQAYSAKTAAIAALTWAANSILLLTGTATASVQALAAHVVTFLQSASAADARTAIGAGDVTGPASSTNNAITRFDLSTGKIIQNSGATVDDSGNVYAANAMGINSAQVVGLAGNQLRWGNASSWFQHAWYTDAALKMLLDINGQLGIGTATPQGKIHSYQTGGGFLHRYASGVAGSATTVIPNGTGDVTKGVSGTYTIEDGAGGFDGGEIAPTTPGNNLDLFTDGGANVCQLQVAADGSVTVVRTAGARTYAVNLQLNWM